MVTKAVKVVAQLVSCFEALNAMLKAVQGAPQVGLPATWVGLLSRVRIEFHRVDRPEFGQKCVLVGDEVVPSTVGVLPRNTKRLAYLVLPDKSWNIATLKVIEKKMLQFLPSCHFAPAGKVSQMAWSESNEFSPGSCCLSMAGNFLWCNP